MSLDWDAVVAHALALPDTVLATYYGDAAVKANDRPILTPGREPGSFCLHTNQVEMLMTIDPDTFWQTPHYEGYPAVLVRYGTENVQIVLDQIEASRDWAMVRPKPKSKPKSQSKRGPRMN